MALVTLEGVYRHGKVELTEVPEGAHEASPVLVTFLSGPANGALDAASEEKEAERKAAVERMLARMKEGLDFGGVPFSRDELYEERLKRFDR